MQVAIQAIGRLTMFAFAGAEQQDAADSQAGPDAQRQESRSQGGVRQPGHHLVVLVLCCVAWSDHRGGIMRAGKILPMSHFQSAFVVLVTVASAAWRICMIRSLFL